MVATPRAGSGAGEAVSRERRRHVRHGAEHPACRGDTRVPYLRDSDSRALAIEEHHRIRDSHIGECSRERKRRGLHESDRRDALDCLNPARERRRGHGEDEPIVGADSRHHRVPAHREEPLGLQLQDVAPLGRRQRRERDPFHAEQLQIDCDRNVRGGPHHRPETHDRLLRMLGVERHLERLHVPPRPPGQHNRPEMPGTELQSDSASSPQLTRALQRARALTPHHSRQRDGVVAIDVGAEPMPWPIRYAARITACRGRRAMMSLVGAQVRLPGIVARRSARSYPW